MRLMDRVFDNHVMAPMQRPVAEALGAGDRLPAERAKAAERLQIAYAWLEARLEGRT